MGFCTHFLLVYKTLMYTNSVLHCQARKIRSPFSGRCEFPVGTIVCGAAADNRLLGPVPANFFLTSHFPVQEQRLPSFLNNKSSCASLSSVRTAVASVRPLIQLSLCREEASSALMADKCLCVCPPLSRYLINLPRRHLIADIVAHLSSVFTSRM